MELAVAVHVAGVADEVVVPGAEVVGEEPLLGEGIVYGEGVHVAGVVD